MMRLCYVLMLSLFAVVAFASQQDIADDKATVNRWEGSAAKFGLLIYTGNTESADISASLDLRYTEHSWTNFTKLVIDFSSDNGETTAESYQLKDQIQYAFFESQRHYVYGDVDFLLDKFDAYKYQGTFSAGYGYQLVKTDQWQVGLQGGPGVRYYQVSGSQQSDTDIVVDTASRIAWQANSDLTLSENLQYTIGETYNYFQSLSAVQNRIIGNLLVELSYELQYYSSIPPGSDNDEKMDTVTRISLIYKF